jgi:hypothetical protein
MHTRHNRHIWTSSQERTVSPSLFPVIAGKEQEYVYSYYIYLNKTIVNILHYIMLCYVILYYITLHYMILLLYCIQQLQ